MAYLLGIDFGGSASKATLIDFDGNIIATASCEYQLYYPQEGWSEQSPEVCYKACVDNIQRILSHPGILPEQIVALSLDSATHIAVLLDRDERVIRPAIHWSDKRSTVESKFLNDHYAETIKQQTLNIPSPLWTLPQLMWLNTHEKDAMKRVSKILFLKDYIRHRLTGDWYTDRIEAMGSMLMDEGAGKWSRELCDLAQIGTEVLPELVEPTHIAGRPTKRACEETRLSPDTKIVVGSTDTVLEVLASGALHLGQCTVKLATAGRICPITDHGIINQMIVNYRHLVPGMWYPGTLNKTSAAAFRWYRDILCAGEVDESKRIGKDVYAMLDEAAAVVPPGSDRLYFHPYLLGEAAPYADNNLRASFVGISAFHTKGHFSRAVMEGVCYSLRDSMEWLNSIGISPASANIIGGGARSDLWSQMTADILNIPLTKTITDDSSLGSAMLAGVAVGAFHSFEHAVETCSKIDRVYMPNAKNVPLYNENFHYYKSIQHALSLLYTEMVTDAS